MPDHLKKRMLVAKIYDHGNNKAAAGECGSGEENGKEGDLVDVIKKLFRLEETLDFCLGAFRGIGGMADV